MNRQERSPEYRALMQSAEWQVIRAQVMWRALGICEWCQNDVARSVHHLTYQSLTDPESMRALCNDCHDNHTDGSRLDVYALRMENAYIQRQINARRQAA